MSTADVSYEWNAALADAELDQAAVALWAFDSASSSRGVNAVYYAPGVMVDDTGDDPCLGSVRGALDLPANRNRHRVCLWTGVPRPLVSARMRHELEHARQCRKHGSALWWLAELVGDVLAEVVGDAPGGAALYNATPIEIDASAAASRYVAQRYGDAVTRDLLDSKHAATDGPNLRPQLDPGPIETLPTRTLAFLWAFPEACAAFERRNETLIATALEAVWPGGHLTWNRLEELLV